MWKEGVRPLMEAQKGKNNILFERLFRSKKISTYGKAVENATEIAKQFNSYFSSIADHLRSGLGNTPSDLSKLVNFVESCKDLASHAGVFRGARISSLRTNACSTEDNIPFPRLANHVVLSKF